MYLNWRPEMKKGQKMSEQSRAKMRATKQQRIMKAKISARIVQLVLIDNIVAARKMAKAHANLFFFDE